MMMRAFAALVLSWSLALVAGPGQAITIDSGSIVAAAPTDFHPGFDIHGNGFSMTSLAVQSQIPLPFALWLAPGDLTGTAPILTRAVVTLNGASADTLVSGTLTFAVAPLVSTPEPSAPNLLRREGAFTMTGALSVSGQTVDVDGQGNAHIIGLPFGPTGLIETPLALAYDFASDGSLAPIPEPATLMLLVTGGGLAALYRLRCRGREDHHR